MCVLAKRERIKRAWARIKPVRWCVVALRAKYFVISKQNDFEANEWREAIYFSKRIYERRHKVYYKPLHRRSKNFAHRTRTLVFAGYLL